MRTGFPNQKRSLNVRYHTQRACIWNLELKCLINWEGVRGGFELRGGFERAPPIPVNSSAKIEIALLCVDPNFLKRLPMLSLHRHIRSTTTTTTTDLECFGRPEAPSDLELSSEYSYVDFCEDSFFPKLTSTPSPPMNDAHYDINPIQYHLKLEKTAFLTSSRRNQHRARGAGLVLFPQNVPSIFDRVFY